MDLNRFNIITGIILFSCIMASTTCTINNNSKAAGFFIGLCLLDYIVLINHKDKVNN